MTKIVFSTCFNFLHDLTNNRALDNVCKKYNLPLKIVSINGGHDKFVDNLIPDKDVLLYFNIYDCSNKRESYEKIRKLYPNAKFVGIGSDLMYVGTDLVWPYDIFIDYSEHILEIVKQKHNCTTYKIFWTISEDVIELCKNTYKIVEKTKDLLCMFRCDVGDRPFILNQIEKIGLSIQREIERETLYEYYDFRSIKYDERLIKQISYYLSSWFVLGTTSAVWSNKPRSMKGLRDYVAPFCGTAMLTDDYPDFLNLEHIIPLYNYFDFNKIKQIVDYFKNNSDAYNQLIEKQKNWILENTMEKNFEKILQSEGII